MRRNEKLAQAIEVLWGSCPGAERMEIDIEMPLNSGLQLIATGFFGAEKRGVRVRNAGAFYSALKDDTSDGAWNRMHIDVSSPAEFKVKRHFDEMLRNETEELVK